MLTFLRRRRSRVAPAEAARRTEAGEAVLLDVREAHEWRAGHAPAAVHLPLSRLSTGAALPKKAQGRPVVAVCRSGARSRQAARLLAGRGVAVTDVAGGMSAWSRAGLPVVDGRGRPGTVV
ncbi:hypothetical protein GCM10009716_45050 [Streptomyces sodiiphilus]|uniref:Rhodanese domain-containing protein n=1 Tax=Streptomyces sodiiphilus TaxID=226217 RepID=A0ABN2PV88_9ACTN